jgi:hypothetical protein
MHKIVLFVLRWSQDLVLDKIIPKNTDIYVVCQSLSATYVTS